MLTQNQEAMHSGTHGDCSWSIEKDGTLRIYPSDDDFGILASIKIDRNANDLGLSNIPWMQYNTDVFKVVIEEGVATNEHADLLFANLTNCEKMDLSNLDTWRTKSMEKMFMSDYNLSDLDLSTFERTSLRNSKDMFKDCMFDLNVTWGQGTHGECSWKVDRDFTLQIFPTNGEQGLLKNTVEKQKEDMSRSPWHNHSMDIQKVIVEDGVIANKDASMLFIELFKCKEMDLSGLNTSKVENAEHMFNSCSSLKHLDLSNQDFSNVKNTKSMFYGCNPNLTVLANDFDVTKLGVKAAAPAWEPPKTEPSWKDKEMWMPPSRQEEKEKAKVAMLGDKNWTPSI